ncbi:MAG: redoxin domain-containing protein [Bacteroidota bacterium]
MKKLMIITGIIILSLNIALAQKEVNQRIPLIGAEVPSFIANSTNGEISFPEDFGNKWKIVFAHPRDYTPVCSSEVLELAYMQNDFKALNAEIVVLSTDGLEAHNGWKSSLEELDYKNRGSIKINFPLVEDTSYAIANKFGMLDSKANTGQSIRGVFFVNPENKISAFYFYPNEVGRNIDEIQRTLVALQTNYKDNRIVLPANWQVGDDVMVNYLDATERDADGNPDAAKGFYNKTWFMNYKEVK